MSPKMVIDLTQDSDSEEQVSPLFVFLRRPYSAGSKACTPQNQPQEPKKIIIIMLFPPHKSSSICLDFKRAPQMSRLAGPPLGATGCHRGRLATWMINANRVW